MQTVKPRARRLIRDDQVHHGGYVRLAWVVHGSGSRAFGVTLEGALAVWNSELLSIQTDKDKCLKN
jgi:hypothetical protein